MLGFNIVLSSFDILTDAIEDFDRATGGKPSEHPMGRAVAPEPDVEKTAVSSPAVSLPKEPQRAPKPSKLRIEPVALGKDEWVRWRESDGVLVGALSGPIEAVAVERLDGELEPRLRSKPILVLLDLGGVDYVSSTGWGLLAKIHQELQTWGGAMALCRMNPDLYEIFGYLQLRSIINTYPTQEAALSAFEGRGVGVPSGKIETIAPADDDEWMAAAGLEETRGGGSEPRAPDRASQTIDHASVDEVLGEPAAEEISAESEEVRASNWEDASREVAPASEPDRSGWKSPDLDAVDSPESRETPQEPAGEKAEEAEEAGRVEENVFAEFSSDSQRISVDSAVNDDRLETDERLREIGWEQYGQRLKSARKRKKKDGGEPEDEALP